MSVALTSSWIAVVARVGVARADNVAASAVNAAAESEAAFIAEIGSSFGGRINGPCAGQRASVQLVAEMGRVRQTFGGRRLCNEFTPYMFSFCSILELGILSLSHALPVSDLDRPTSPWDATLRAVAGEAMAESQGTLFDERFLERYAGAIINDPEVAIVELVANAWDAWATRVDIRWAERGDDQTFSITDDGKGMSEAQFLRRWRTLDYNKLVEEGPTATPPDELKEFGPRRTYGRNGKGRHAAFRFGDPYVVRTWCDGREITYEVRRQANVPFDLNPISERTGVAGHGTEISAPGGTGVIMTPQQVREVIGIRFLSDPNFKVRVDGTEVTFQDVPSGKLRELDVEVPGYGNARLTVIDALKADKTTRQHGLAWWVDGRLVGRPGWTDFELDGRTSEAKRFVFIVHADLLADSAATLPDWTGFHPRNPAWVATREAVFAKIREFLASFNAERPSKEGRE